MNLGIQMLNRIRELHSLGYVHLDIKPSNIMADKKMDAGMKIKKFKVKILIFSVILKIFIFFS